MIHDIRTVPYVQRMTADCLATAATECRLRNVPDTESRLDSRLSSQVIKDSHTMALAKFIRYLSEFRTRLV